MDKILQQVYQFAAAAHEGQSRKYSPEPFIVHPDRVMRTCSRYTSDPVVLSAALLHDVLEDTQVTRERMHEFLCLIMEPHHARRTVYLVEQLTNVYVKETYPGWSRKQRKKEEIKRLAKISADAQTIKYADIIDNCDAMIHHDHEQANRFLSDSRALLREIDKGNSVLYIRALETVDAGMAELKQLRKRQEQL